MQQKNIDNIINQLWPQNATEENRHVYAILDGARDAQIEPMVRVSKLPHDCLYNEPLTDKLRTAAPQIIELTASAKFTQQLLDLGWGKSWGIFLITYPLTTLKNVRQHFRKLNFVQGPAGEKLMFRYCDPRVLGAFLPTCTHDEVHSVFGPAIELIMEGENANLLLSFERSEQGCETEIYSV